MYRFFIEYEKNTYFLTAQHIFKNGLTNIHFPLINLQNIIIDCPIFIFPIVDTIVFKNPKFLLNTHHSLKVNTQINLGENICIFGYPYGLIGYGFPFIKKGCVSGIIKQPDSVNSLYLDLYNNQGFSGGPILNNNMEVIGLVHGFVNDTASNPNNPIILNSGLTKGFCLFDILNLIKTEENKLL